MNPDLSDWERIVWEDIRADHDSDPAWQLVAALMLMVMWAPILYLFWRLAG